MKHNLYVFLLISLGMQISCIPTEKQLISQAEQDLAWLHGYDERETMEPVLRLALLRAELQSQITLLEQGCPCCIHPINEQKALHDETTRLLEAILCTGHLSEASAMRVKLIEAKTHDCKRNPTTARRKYVSMLMAIISSEYMVDKKQLFIRELRIARGDGESRA